MKREAELNLTVMLMVTALDLAPVVMPGGVTKITYLAVTLATSLFGFSLWNWPTNKFSYGATLLTGAGGTLFLLAWTAARNHATVSLPALPILLLVLSPILRPDTRTSVIPAPPARRRQSCLPRCAACQRWVQLLWPILWPCCDLYAEKIE